MSSFSRDSLSDDMVLLGRSMYKTAIATFRSASDFAVKSVIAEFGMSDRQRC